VEHIRARILSSLSADQFTSLDTIKAAFDNRHHWLVEIHLAIMIDQGVLAARGNGNEMLFLLKEVNHTELIQRNNAAAEAAYAIAATLPETLVPIAKNIIQTRKAMRDLLAGAVKEVLVSQPFIDNTFVDIYEDEIRDLAKRDVKLVLVTRKVSTDTTNIKGILKIFEIYAMQGKKSLFEVYEHWIPLRIDQIQSKQFVGLHAKLVIGSDAAYVGSANWTGFSLSNNVEIGMVIRDEQMLSQLNDLFSLIITQSTRIDIEMIHQKLVYKARDHYDR
jgi:phosphatidylserine/phosphatidylglycerophosphate/cardiolipin synthase-like enzyme